VLAGQPLEKTVQALAAGIAGPEASVVERQQTGADKFVERRAIENVFRPATELCDLSANVSDCLCGTIGQRNWCGQLKGAGRTRFGKLRANRHHF
jgi:hypothetical protein